MSAAPKAPFMAAFAPLFTPCRYKVSRTGRGTGKTMQYARALVIQSRSKRLNILCGREYQNSIAESVYSVIVSTIYEFGIQNEFIILKNEIKHRRSGSRFFFKGLHHNIESVKSLHDTNILWIEEAASISQETIEVVFPSIRANGSEIWISYNQDLEEDPINMMFFEGKHIPKDKIIMTPSWRDNPWFPKELADLRAYDFERDPETAEWIWENAYRPRNRYMVYDNWTVERFESPPPRDENYRKFRFRYGLDWGFGADASAANRLFTKDNVLYIDHEFHGDPRKGEIDLDFLASGMPDGSSPVERACPGISDSLEAYADSSQPQSIKFMNRRGFSLKPAEKPPGSVEDGILFIRAFDKIVVHERCEHTIQEFKMYRYKRKKSTDETISEPEDSWNHHMDSIRYALNEDIFDSGAIEIPQAAAMAMLSQRGIRARNRRRR